MTDAKLPDLDFDSAEFKAFVELAAVVEKKAKETRSLGVKLNTQAQKTSTFTSGIYNGGAGCQANNERRFGR